MSEESINNIIEKYKAGTSSLDEEKTLFNSKDNTEESIKLWSLFVKKNKLNAPKNLNEKLWDSFEKKDNISNKNKIWLYSAVATIALLVSVYINSVNENSLTNSEKQALLNEAKSMFADSNENNYVNQIILESELVVVYTKTKN